MVRSVNVKKTKKFKENRPENYHVHDSHRHQINANFSDFEMLVAEHESLVTQVEKLADPQY